MSGLRGYDEWKTRSPDDDYAMRHPERFRRGKYTVTVTRSITAMITVEVEASSEDDAVFDAAIAVRKIPLDKWTIDQDDSETTNVEGPPERDPDDARDEEYDR